MKYKHVQRKRQRVAGKVENVNQINVFILKISVIIILFHLREVLP